MISRLHPRAAPSLGPPASPTSYPVVLSRSHWSAHPLSLCQLGAAAHAVPSAWHAVPCRQRPSSLPYSGRSQLKCHLLRMAFPHRRISHSCLPHLVPSQPSLPADTSPALHFPTAGLPDRTMSSVWSLLRAQDHVLRPHKILCWMNKHWWVSSFYHHHSLGSILVVLFHRKKWKIRICSERQGEAETRQVN